MPYELLMETPSLWAIRTGSTKDLHPITTIGLDKPNWFFKSTALPLEAR
jgi:hypothetical protein